MSAVQFLSRAQQPRIWTSTADPTNGDDTADGVNVGDGWINTASLQEFVCISAAAGAARWRHKPWTAGQGVGPADHTGDTNNTKVGSVLIPAGCMGANGRLEISVNWSNNNSGNNKTRTVYFGAADDLTGTQFSATNATTTVATNFLHAIQNMNATNAQEGNHAVSATGGPGSFGSVVTAAIDTAAAAYVVFAVQLANSGDSAGLDHYTVKLFRPDIT